MKAYYIELASWGTALPNIIDEEMMFEAEHGMNYLDADDFVLLCQADSFREAEAFYWSDLSSTMICMMAEEAMHP